MHLHIPNLKGVHCSGQDLASSEQQSFSPRMLLLSVPFCDSRAPLFWASGYILGQSSPRAEMAGTPLTHLSTFRTTLPLCVTGSARHSVHAQGLLSRSQLTGCYMRCSLTQGFPTLRASLCPQGSDHLNWPVPSLLFMKCWRTGCFGIFALGSWRSWWGAWWRRLSWLSAGPPTELVL